MAVRNWKLPSPPASSLQEHHSLAIMRHITDILSSLGIIDHRTTGHVDVNILTIGAVAFIPSSIASMLRIDMALITQVEQRPIVVVATEIDAATFATVATIWAAIGIVLDMLEVHGSFAALARATAYFHIIYEV